MVREGRQHRPGISILDTQVHPNAGRQTLCRHGSSMSPRMKALAQSQDKIGYHNFMEGYISIHFYEIQNFHLAMSSSFLNGANWAKQFISKILHITHSQWIFRNFSLHNKRNGYLHKKKAEEIALELESLAGLAPEDVPTNSQFLLEINFSDLNKSNLESQKYWILAINAALTAQQRQLGATNARVGELIGTILYLVIFFLHLPCSY